MKISFHNPIFPDNINSILKESIDSGWVTTGPKTFEFEKRLSDYLKARHILAVNSCTAALHLALAAKGVGQGDKFIVPTYTFVSSVEVGEYLGAEPILIDSDPDTFNLNLDEVERILSERKDSSIKAIIPVHFGGRPVDMLRLMELAKKDNLFVLEDAAHAFETVSNIGKVGYTNYAAAFSFYANKNITTGGEGGAVATNDKNLANRMRKLSLHGMNKDGWKRFEAIGKWAYDVSELGYKYNMTDISASLGLEQLTHVNKWHKRRLEIVQQYDSGMFGINGLILPKNNMGSDHAWHLYILKIIPERWKISRNKLISEINNRGIGTSVHYKPVHMHSYYINKYNYKANDYPIAKRLSETVITIPLYPKLTNIEVDYIVKVVNELWNKFKVI
jgi:dTDP-4-amino-4,6-dideoxygalactose transaminase